MTHFATKKEERHIHILKKRTIQVRVLKSNQPMTHRRQNMPTTEHLMVNGWDPTIKCYYDTTPSLTQHKMEFHLFYVQVIIL